MARIDIDTTSTEYRNKLSRFRAIRTSLRPNIRMYQKLPDSKKERWLERDPLLRELVEFSKRIGEGKDDD